MWREELSSGLLRAEALWTECRGDGARLAMRLRDVLPNVAPTMLSEITEILLGRQKALEQGIGPQQGFFTRQSVEQASRPSVAERHARYFQGSSHVLEICSGIGVDSVALARVAKQVTCIELSPQLTEYAERNLALQGINNVTVLQGAAEDIVPTLDLGTYDGLWADPSRRQSDGRRIQDMQQYKPALGMVMAIPLRGVRGIKVSPAAQLDECVAEGWAREVIGFAEGCIEQTLWSGADVSDGTVYLADRDFCWTPLDREAAPSNGKLEVGAFLIEPHAALIRSGYLACFYAEQKIQLLEEEFAWGITAIKPHASPLQRVFKILEVMPFSVKKLATRLKELQWNNRTEIKKRAFPHEDPEELRPRLKLRPPSSDFPLYGVVLMCTLRGQPLCILASREL